MTDVLPSYHLNAATWCYLSVLLVVAVYFRFLRFWSLRNLDLVLLMAFSPALIFLRSDLQAGNTILFIVSGLLLVRLFFDGVGTRRPRMEQNLNPAGLSFLAICAFSFLATNVATLPLPDATLNTVKRGEKMQRRVDASNDHAPTGPTATIIAAPVSAITEAISDDRAQPGGEQSAALVITARILSVLAHLAVVIGLFVIGKSLCGDSNVGLAMATLYLLLPCTFIQAGELNHVLPAALILWAIVCWRKPVAAGVLLGLACGTLVFPIFLLPLWTVFYGRRHAKQFAFALLAVGTVLVGSYALISQDPQSFARQTLGAIDWSIFSFQAGATGGFWNAQNAAYRIPVISAFAILLCVVTIWPRKKNLEHLISASAAIIVGTQFWFPAQGGVYLLWFLPLTVVVMFRTRLSHLTLQLPIKPKETQNPASTPAGRELVSQTAGTSLFH